MIDMSTRACACTCKDAHTRKQQQLGTEKGHIEPILSSYLFVTRHLR